MFYSLKIYPTLIMTTVSEWYNDFWTILYTFSHSCTDLPQFNIFVQTLFSLVPNDELKTDLLEYLQKLPPTSIQGNELVKWVNILHNNMNQVLNTPICNFDEKIKELEQYTLHTKETTNTPTTTHQAKQARAQAKHVSLTSRLTLPPSLSISKR